MNEIPIPEKNEKIEPIKNDNFELNLFNPLWVYDLFPLIQCSWNRMPFAGENDEPSNLDNGSESEDRNEEPLGEDADDNNLSNEPIDNQDEPEDKSDRDNDSNNSNDPYPDRSNEYNLENPDPSTPNQISGLTITKNPNGSFDYHREFNSWDEFVSCAADDNLYAWKNRRESHNPNQETAGAAATFNEAVQMAQFRGWPEGRKLLSDLMANIFTKPEIFEAWGFDVAGMFPVVPAYLSGDPSCMMIEPNIAIRAQHPIIRIDYNNYVASFVKPLDMMVRGAAILSLANNLEDRGFQTELRITANCSGTLGSSYSSPKCMFRYSIIFKKPSEFIDIDRAAFALAHPASMRRLGFALLEQHAELKPGFGENYGFITALPNDELVGTMGHIFVPGSEGNETNETSKTAVLEAAKATTENLDKAV